ncbi:MAG: hypothetical protein VYA69_09680 [Gemmatimonadota bacterium]|nr:hypothetical protein [Gemmatimonadota bacterium]
MGIIIREIAELAGTELEKFLHSEKFHTPSWKSDDKKIELIEKAVSLSCDVLVRDYRQNSSTPDFIHRNWFREQDTLSRLKDSITLDNITGLENIHKSYSD